MWNSQGYTYTLCTQINTHVHIRQQCNHRQIHCHTRKIIDACSVSQHCTPDASNLCIVLKLIKTDQVFCKKYGRMESGRNMMCKQVKKREMLLQKNKMSLYTGEILISSITRTSTNGTEEIQLTLLYSVWNFSITFLLFAGLIRGKL